MNETSKYRLSNLDKIVDTNNSLSERAGAHSPRVTPARAWYPSSTSSRLQAETWARPEL